ncbi:MULTISPECIES: ATP-binding protein [Streptomyces]|uniref:Putative anti-sigma factor n=1 Tax=Streptomyces venezuelae (strain ATCC 10712 / CBS 650.69 / DSM 40230 / JCM 4526 / NBRC 13096 / PD 04745) TaxID=953739 RepID=F2RAC2_STRVP|nr:ATP-binding protein [Streptomyces venezuelae]APE22422.1 anti-sigma regulatory factor [Streptomyces venezuelae]QER99806.1 ATP-binding protein [Streptomyces venezuelae ATCC 10712]QES06848.1 ATP-binding protein [Streptomyces venezuelae]QES14425.1 ATP-binding protein [Streptomyces venezuelae]CCA56604.1 putative anti-sigma factor [Streptomyces venezuelae ATCC 10712]
MATVELRFSAQPEHVRTARLVAAAVARRAGVDEAVLDEVRLAVGEACSRAVGLHRSNDVMTPIRVVLTEEEKTFSIEVGDEVPGAGVAAADAVGVPGARAAAPAEDFDDADGEDEMGLAVIRGLVDDVEVSAGEDGGTIRMSWPVSSADVLS